jgi:5-methylcytosine-specific restriction endonuclease McrA
MTRTYVPATLRQQVYERAEGRCEYCLIPETVTLTTHQVDHIVALKHGGRTEADNLALSCALCNTP